MNRKLRAVGMGMLLVACWGIPSATARAALPIGPAVKAVSHSCQGGGLVILSGWMMLDRDSPEREREAEAGEIDAAPSAQLPPGPRGPGAHLSDDAHFVLTGSHRASALRCSRLPGAPSHGRLDLLEERIEDGGGLLVNVERGARRSSG